MFIPTRSAATEATTMMLPECCGMKHRFATAWLRKSTLVEFKVMTLFQASRGYCSAGAPQLVPALIAILAPISPRAWAICSPSPREPPVTRATFPFSSNNSRTPMSRHLEKAGGALAATDAHRDHHELGTAPLAFDERMSRQASTAHPIGMSHCNRSPVDVQPVIGNAQLISAIKDLAGESFVQFPQINVADFVAGTLQESRYRINRTDAHLGGLAA